jgi:glycosyltransferase involved in cell wall biosynthesis
MVVPGGVDRSGTHRVIPCILWLIERVARAHELHVFALTQEPRPATWPLLGATVHNVGGGRGLRTRAVAMIHREHRRGRFDVLAAQWATPGAIAAAAGVLTGRPVMVHLPGGDLARVPEAAYGRLGSRRGRLELKAMAALAKRVTVPSEPLVEAAARLGIRAERLPMGVSTAHWPPLPPRRRAPNEEARLLFVGNLNRVKDPWMLLRAMRHLRGRGERFRLDVIGLDTLDGEIQRLAAGLELDDAVRFHGFLPQRETREWMERAHLLLHTSRWEGGPIVALEAAAAGVPAVGTHVGHLAEWAPAAASTVPVGACAALGDAVRALLGDEDRRLALAAEAQRRALAEDADWSAARWMELAERLASRK